jgi:hypothetical protein
MSNSKLFEKKVTQIELGQIDRHQIGDGIDYITGAIDEINRLASSAEKLVDSRYPNHEALGYKSAKTSIETGRCNVIRDICNFSHILTEHAIK